MKILHILSQRPEQTGSGVYINQMMRQAFEAGHENALLAGVPAGYCHPDEPSCCETFFVRFGSSEPDALPHDVAGMSDVMPYPSVRFRDFSDPQLDTYEHCFSLKIQDAVRTFRPDIIHVNHLWIAASLVRRMFSDIPVVASCHGSDIRQFRENPHLRERVLSGCSGVNAVCALHSMQKQEICELYGLPEERVYVTGVGYDTAMFYAAPKPAATPVRICYAGKLANAKGVPWLLRAMELLHSDHGNDVVLELCGSGAGSEEAEIRRHAERLESCVVLHGNLKPAALAEVMRQSHIFVLPSFYEGLPLVMLEALACGCRLVGTALPGVIEAFGTLDASLLRTVPLPRLHGTDVPYAEDENGFVHALAESLAAMVHWAQTEPSPADSAMRAAVLDACSWRAVFDRVNRIYGELEEFA